MRDNGTYTATVQLERLRFDPENYNEHPPEQVAELQDALQEYGYVRRIVVQEEEEPGWYRCVAGEGVATALKMEEAGEVEATIIPADWSRDQVLAYLIADNEIARMANRRDEDLAGALALLGDQADVLPMGLSAEERAELQKYLDQADEPEEEEPAPGPEKTPEELQEEWGTKEGQLWRIGDHVLAIGDATDPAVWLRALDVANEERLAGVVTSPPYAEQRKDHYSSIAAGQYVAWWMDTIEPLLAKHLRGDGSFFLNLKAHTEDGRRHTYDKRLVLAMEDAGWIYFEEFAWKKPGYPGRFKRRFKNGWEPIHHFTRSTEPRANIESVFEERESEIHAPHEPLKDHQGTYNQAPRDPINLVRPDNVIVANVDRTGVAGDEHPARFPIAIPAFFIQAYSFAGDLWLDLFSGTGSTGIAAEEHGRRYVGIELDPRWGAVQLQRFVNDYQIEGELYG